jgi:hypothetical protein
MASKEELENARKLTEATNQLKNTLDEVLFVQRSLTDEARKTAKSYFDSTTQANATSKVFRQISNLTAEINAELANITSGLGGIENLEKQALKNRQAQAALDIELSQVLDGIVDQKEKERILDLEGEDRAKALNTLAKDQKGNTKDILNLYTEQSIQLDKQLDSFEEIERRAKNIENGMGLTGKAFGGLGDAFKKIGGGKFAETLGLDEAVSKGKQLSASLTKGGKIQATGAMKTQVMGKMFSVVGKNIAKAFGPFALIAELIQGIMQADKETVELQKSMALTRTEAMGFRTELASAAASSGDINITSTKLLETFSNLNKQFGFITNFATDTLVTMTKLTKVVGIGAESAGNLAAASSLTGDSFEDNYKDVLATSYELQRQSGVQMDLRDILEQSGKVTGTVRANLGANPSLIAKAITQAKLFGASLEDVANAGKALLNFEQSIEAELQAELLLGRNLNLERARAAALAGDQVTLAEELQKQAGNFEEFTAMNVIQQEALASAMGMQSDQLADILFQQEIQGKTARELRAAGKEELAQRLEAQTLADKFNATVDKLKGIFSDVGTAFMPILQVFGAALSLVGAIVGLVGDLFKMLGGDFSFSGFTSGLEGVVGALGFSTADDAIIPAGYGDTIIKKGKDTIALNNEDSVVAGTNLGGGGTDMNETNQLLKMLVTQNKEKPQISPVGLYQVQ